MNKLKIIAPVLVGLLLVWSFASAQGAGTSKITGTVNDNENIPLPGVSVVAKSPALVGTATAVTDDTGTFRLLSLNPGLYTLTFTLQGFKTKIRENIVIGIEQTIAMGKIILEQGNIEEQITVVGQSPLIDVKSSMKAVNMSREVFQSLPKGRNFADLMTVLPGVNYESRAAGFSVDGGSGAENTFYVDGSDTTNSRTGTQGQTVITDFIEEVQVKASGYNAEFGGSLGGVVNVITRSGGDEYHGDVIGYLTGRFLGTKGYNTWRYDPYSTTTPPAVEWYNTEEERFGGKDTWSRVDGVISLGGYILKNRLWFFGSFNPQYYKYNRDLYFLADTTHTKKNYYTYNSNTDAQLKLTSQVTKNLRISLSGVYNMNKDRRTLPNKLGTGSMTTPYDKTGYSYPGSSGTGSLDYSLGNNFLVSLRGGWWATDTTDQLLLAPGTLYSFSRSNVNLLDVPAEFQHPSGWSTSALAMTNTKKMLRSRQYANFDVTYYLNLAGEHSWRAGLQWVRLHDDLDATYDYPAVYLNWNNEVTTGTGEKVRGKYGYYTVNHSFSSPYGRNGNVSTNRWAFYVQDSWTIQNRLTVNLGVRAEDEVWPIYSTAPEWKGKSIFHFKFGDKISPRLSLVYDLFGDSSLKLYASVSRIYDVMKTYAAEESYGGFSWIDDFYTLNTYDFTQIAKSGDRTKTNVETGGTWIQSYNMRWFNLETTDVKNTKPVSKDEYSIGFDKKISEEFVFTTRVVYDHLNYIIEDCGWAVPEGELYITGNPGYGMMLPQSEGGLFPNEFFRMPKAKREYWGINLNLEKRFSGNWAGGINYTLSWLKGNSTGLGNSWVGDTPNRPGATRAFDSWTQMYDAKGNTQDTWLYTDRRHYIKAYGTYRFPFGLTVGARAYLMSGLPYEAYMTLKGYPFFPYGWSKDRYPWDRWLDLYLEYNLKVLGKFTIQLNANIDNVLQMSYATSKALGLTYRGAYVTDAVFTSKAMDVDALIKQYIPHPVYGMDNGWFGPRRATRLGMKISW